MNGEGEGAHPARQHAARFCRQHAEILELSKGVVRRLDARELGRDPTEARRALATFAGRLRVHAAMEQEALYPRLLASPRLAIAEKARELLDDVGHVYEAFFAFLARWPDGPTIQSDPEAFRRETMAELQRLRRRIERENDELYPMVEALGPA